MGSVYEADYVDIPVIAEEEVPYLSPEKLEDLIGELTTKMKEAAKNLEFEEAAKLRDQIQAVEKQALHALSF